MILHSEIEPLLPNIIPDVPRRNQNSNSKKLLVFTVCSILILAAEFGFFMAQAPQTAIFEKTICRNHGLLSQANGTTGVDPCKSELVQGELALILGYKDTFEVLPGKL